MPARSDARFRTWLTTARKAAEAGDIATVVHIAETQLGLNVRVGPEFAGTLLLHGTEFDRTDDSRLPGVVRRLLRGDSGPDRPVWKHRVQGVRVFLHSELTPELIEQASAYEPAMPLGGLPEDPRVQYILDGLSAMERETLLAFFTSGAQTWREAAEVAGAPQDPRFAEHVRRQVRRLARSWRTAA